MSKIDHEKLLKLLNSLPMFVSYINTDFRYEFANEAYKSFLGKDPEGKTVKELLGVDYFEQIRPNVEKVLKGRTVNFENTFTKDGRLYHMEGIYIPDMSASGEVVGFYVHVRDNTKKKLIQEELHRSEENYKHMFARNPMPMCIWDLETMKFLEVNETMVEHYGYSREEFLQMSVLELRPTEEIDDFMERFSTLAPGYRKEARLFIHRKKDGSKLKVLNVSNDIIFNGRKSRIVLINDVTERLKVEEERETLLEALREAVRTRDEFLTMASHELKTPITSLILNTDLKKLIVRRGEKTDPQKELEALNVQLRQLNRINQLIEDMMDLSRIRIGKLEMNKKPVDFAKVVEDSLTKLGPLLIQTLGEVNFDTVESAEVHADPFRLEQVVTNLLSNAIKYGEKKPISVSVKKTEARVVLIVEDQGRGISFQDQKRIFKRFERAVAGTDISGLGLGLTIVKEIIDSHQGHISVESVPGKGSKFIVELPLYQI
ncbi:MAG: ATP-binding protein [Bacteriovoracaceae bacterium]